jgi:multimeric flavodoxin WrbA
MQLTVFNGSPRGKKSNTVILLEHFLKGFMEIEGNSSEIVYLVDNRNREKRARIFRNARHVILAFPLYVDCMPGIVKSFIESLKPLCGRQGNPSIGFIVQGGFPEAYHSRFVERYLRKFATRLKSPYAGCMIKGGFETTPSMPRFMTRSIFSHIYELGKTYGKKGTFDDGLVNRLASPEHLSVLRRAFFRFGLFLGLPHIYWDRQLKVNNALKRRFDRPFA